MKPDRKRFIVRLQRKWEGPSITQLQLSYTKPSVFELFSLVKERECSGSRPQLKDLSQKSRFLLHSSFGKDKKGKKTGVCTSDMDRVVDHRSIDKSVTGNYLSFSLIEHHHKQKWPFSILGLLIYQLTPTLVSWVVTNATIWRCPTLNTNLRPFNVLFVIIFFWE